MITELSGAIRRALRAARRLLRLRRKPGPQTVAESPQAAEQGGAAEAAISSRTTLLDGATHAVDAVEAGMWHGYAPEAQANAVHVVLARLTRDELLAVATVLVVLRPPQPPTHLGDGALDMWISSMRCVLAMRERQS